MSRPQQWCIALIMSSRRAVPCQLSCRSSVQVLYGLHWFFLPVNFIYLFTFLANKNSVALVEQTYHDKLHRIILLQGIAITSAVIEIKNKIKKKSWKIDKYLWDSWEYNGRKRWPWQGNRQMSSSDVNVGLWGQHWEIFVWKSEAIGKVVVFMKMLGFGASKGLKVSRSGVHLSVTWREHHL